MGLPIPIIGKLATLQAWQKVHLLAIQKVTGALYDSMMLAGPLFNPFFAAIAYALGAARFWSNYDKTSFDGTQKTKLTALWPILAIGSKNFRDELKKTLN